MKGTVLNFSIQQGNGVISGSDGQRYKFLASSWNLEQSPRPGIKVDFDTNPDGEAIDIYLDLEARSPVAAALNSGNSQSGEVGVGEAVLWFLCCLPIGFMRFGQTGKGWVWVLIAIATGGLGGLVAWVDYWISFTAHQKRQLNDWEFFPK